MATYNITRNRTNSSNRSINSSIVSGYDGYYDMWFPTALYNIIDLSQLSVEVNGVDITSIATHYDTPSEIQVYIPDEYITGNAVFTYPSTVLSDSTTGEVHLINMEHCVSNCKTSFIENGVISGSHVSYTTSGRLFLFVDTVNSLYKNSNRIALIANTGYGIKKSDVDNNTFNPKANKLYLACRYNNKNYYATATINGFDGLTTVDGVDWYTIAYIDFGKALNDKYATYNNGAWALNISNDNARAYTYLDINGVDAINENVGTLDGSIFEPMQAVTTYNVTNNLTQCTTNNNATTVDSDETYSATLTANTGYHFNTENVVVTCGEFDEQFTISQDKQTVTINITDVVGDIYISATATNELPQYDITSTLNYATNSNSATTIEQGQNYSATLTCDNHYTFTGGTLVVTHNNQTVTPTLNANGTVATISINNVQGDIVITGNAVAIQHNFTQSLTNCQFTAISGIQSGNKINDGDTVTGTIRVNNYSSGYSPYYIKPADISITMGGVTQTYTLDSNGYILNFEIQNVTGDVAIAVTASIDTYTLTCNFTGFRTENPAIAIIPTDGVISKNTNIQIQAVALEGYEIKSENISVTIDGVATTNFYRTGHYPSSAEEFNFFEMLMYGDNRRYITGDIVVTVTATSITPPVVNEDFGFCNVYNPTLAELAEVSKKRFYQGSGQSTSYVDMSQFIYRVYKTYLEIPVADDRETVKLANYDTQVLSDVVAETPIDIDCGTVTLNEVFENVIDYSPFTTLDIYLPFIGIQRLDIDVVRNKAIHLVYTFDVLSAKCLAKLMYNNNILYQFAGSIADDIPYVATNTGDYNSNVIQTTTESALTLGKNYPYYIITQNVGIEPDEDIDGVAQYDSVQLSTLTGLVQVNNINLSTTATEEEKAEIEMLLKAGVFINEVTP